jgi:RhoGAP domain
VAGILKLWVASLPEPVIPPRLYDAALRTQTAHADKDAQVVALHGLLRQCEHRVLQVLFPLMEVRIPWCKVIHATYWGSTAPCIDELHCSRKIRQSYNRGAEHPFDIPATQFLHHYCLNQARPARERHELARIFAPMLLRPAGCSVMAPAQVHMSQSGFISNVTC